MKEAHIYMIDRDELEGILRKIVTETIEKIEKEREDYERTPTPILYTKIYDLPLSTRTINCLRAMVARTNPLLDLNSITLGDILRYRKIDLMKTRNFGKDSFRNFMALLDKYGLKMRDEQ